MRYQKSNITRQRDSMTSTSQFPLIAMAITLLFPLAARADTNRATFPENFEQYVLYATFDRGSSKEEAFAAPETLAIAKSGNPLPPGTRIVLGIWSNSKLTDYFVMEKGRDWGLVVAEGQRTGDWHFEQFDPSGQLRRTAIAQRCQSCHQGQASRDFMFTMDRMRAYLP